jgi:hypothetical protein
LRFTHPLGEPFVTGNERQDCGKLGLTASGGVALGCGVGAGVGPPATGPVGVSLPPHAARKMKPMDAIARSAVEDEDEEERGIKPMTTIYENNRTLQLRREQSD